MTRENFCGEFRTARFAAGVVLAVIAAVLVLPALVACDSPLPAYEAECDFYDITLDYDGERTVTLKETVVTKNRTGDALESLAFHLYPNAFSEQAETPPYFAADRDEFFPNGESFGGIEVLSVEIDRQSADFVISGESDTVLEVPCDMENGASARVSIDAVVTLPECDARFGVTESSVNLTGFYPVLCVYENGAWRTDGYTAAGDPFFSQIASYAVRATLPESFSVACSGSFAESTDGGRKVVGITAERVRDFAMCLSEDFSSIADTVTVGGRDVELRYCYLDDDAPADTLNLAADALSFFSRTFGDYPYDTFSMAQAPVGAGGMEYGAFVVIDPDLASREEHERTVVHETAHQWWFGVVGSDQLFCPWLDEGLTEFTTAYYFLNSGDREEYSAAVRSASEYYAVYANMPEAVGFDGRMNRHLSTYLSTGEYVAVTYCKGLVLFDTVFSLCGKEKTEAALRNYFSANAFGIARPQELKAAFSAAGADVGSVIDGFTEDRARL